MVFLELPFRGWG